MTGQININTPLGKYIYDISKKPEVKTIVEIGTWNGCGSTMCIKKAIIDSNKLDYNVISIECDKEMHKLATANFKPIDNFNLVWGTIITESELLNPDVLDNNFFKTYDKITQTQWFLSDKKNISECPNILNILPEKIDLLILDGGEFSTYAEYNKLKNRYKYIVLDDTTCIKSSKIRDILLN